jgi:hypothetical protein
MAKFGFSAFPNRFPGETKARLRAPSLLRAALGAAMLLVGLLAPSTTITNLLLL